MNRKPTKVIDTMNVFEKAHAQREMQQALAFANLVDAVVPRVRYAISDAGRAMQMADGPGRRPGGGSRTANGR